MICVIAMIDYDFSAQRHKVHKVSQRQLYWREDTPITNRREQDLFIISFPFKYIL